MSKNFNGERLAQALVYSGISRSELASLLNVSRQAISQYITANVMPEFEKMTIITDKLGFPASYFFQTDSYDIKMNTTYFRSLLSTNKITRLQHISKVKHLAIIHEILSKYIEYPKLNLPILSYLSNKSNGIDFEKAAQDLRNHWDLGNQPIKDFPYILEKNGIIVTSYSVDQDNIDAYSQKIEINNVERFIVVLSSNKNSAARSNFDAAHELGHIFLHSWDIDLEELPREIFKQQEREANNFAAAFLLPKDAFIRDVAPYSKELKHYIELKRKWNVSISAMLMRANKLDVLSDNQYQYLMKQMIYHKWKKEEPLDDIIIKKEPILLSKSIEILLENEIFDAESFLYELAENGIAMKSEEVEHLLNLPKGKLSVKEKNNSTPIIKLKSVGLKKQEQEQTP